MKYLLISQKSYNLVPVKNLEKRKRNISQLYILIKDDTCGFNKLIFVSANQK